MLNKTTNTATAILSLLAVVGVSILISGAIMPSIPAHITWMAATAIVMGGVSATAWVWQNKPTLKLERNERGITLQTLIVTAVLVLMAVAAGVVIIAITNAASDDLESTAPNLEATCNPVELYDPVLAANGGRGLQYAGLHFAGINGSAAGCVPVCFNTDTQSNSGIIILDTDTAISVSASGDLYERGSQHEFLSRNAGNNVPSNNRLSVDNIRKIFRTAFYDVEYDDGNPNDQEATGDRLRGDYFIPVVVSGSEYADVRYANGQCYEVLADGSRGTEYTYLYLRG